MKIITKKEFMNYPLSTLFITKDEVDILKVNVYNDGEVIKYMKMFDGDFFNKLFNRDLSEKEVNVFKLNNNDEDELIIMEVEDLVKYHDFFSIFVKTAWEYKAQQEADKGYEDIEHKMIKSVDELTEIVTEDNYDVKAEEDRIDEILNSMNNDDEEEKKND